MIVYRQSQPMNKSNHQSPDRLMKEKELIRKNERIKELTQLIEHSRFRQAELVKAINSNMSTIEERENALASPLSYSLLDLDIRNSQLISSQQLQRKRWLADKAKLNVQILGEEKDLRQKLQQLRTEEKPWERTKMLKLMKRKLQLVQNLSKIRAESGLSVSHQRVLLKQYMQDIRVMNGEVQQSNKKYAGVELQYGQAERKVRNTVHDLRVAVGNVESMESSK